MSWQVFRKYGGNMLKIFGGNLISTVEEFLLRKTEENIQRDINHPAKIESLKRNLKALTGKAIDVEDEIKKAEQSGHKKRKREVEDWLQEVQKLGDEICKLEGEVESEGFVSRFLGEDRAAQLDETVIKLVEQSRHFGELVLEREFRGQKLLTSNLVGEAFEKNLKTIWELLRADNVTSIGICGMGGVGKTTLTKHINNVLIKTTQKCVFWVTVSQESSIRMLQDKIAHVVGVNLSDEYDEEKRAAILHEALSSRKNFVLILDDVWKNINLAKVGVQIHEQDCTLIITTRSFQVCRQIGCQNFIRVKTLDTNEAWELFREKLGQEVTLSPQAEEIAKRMAEVCDGLPLGIITLAASMRGETAIHVWKNALAELHKSVMEHENMEEHVFKVLKYSFDRLNPKHQEQGERNGGYTELQCCFLYCSLYPEDHIIMKEDLVRKFISEELVDKRKSRGAQADQVHTILDKLVNVCLLESVDNKCVKMHDLVRAMALRITRGKNMVLAGCLLNQIPNEDEYWTQDIEKMSLMFNSIKEIPDGMSPNCPKLCTLLLQGNWQLKFIADSFFSQMHGLCVLDLSSCEQVPKLPNSVSDLESLKSLILRFCDKLVNVPYLGKLKALKELDLSNCVNLTELPNSVSDLESLRSLILRGCCKLTNVPHLGKLKALKELNLSFSGIRELPQGMDELVNLHFLSMEGAHDFKIFPADLLPKLRNLQCLRLPYQIEAPIIEIESLRKLEEFKGGVSDAADFNQLIGCRPLLKYYILVFPPEYYDSDYGLYGVCNGVTVVGRNYLMEDDVAMLAHDAQDLRLYKCSGLSKSLLDDFPKFNNPKSLKALWIYGCEGIECILAKNGELESHSVAPLGTVTNIRLWKLRDFMGIIVKQEVVLPTPARAVFSSLRELIIIKCDKMKNLGLTGSEFPNLELIRVEDCEEIEEIIEQGGLVSFPKLKRLTLWYLRKLKHVGTTTICDSIEEIDLRGCRALKKLGLLYFPVIGGGESSNNSYSPPPALKTIRISEKMWESLEWEHPSHKQLLQPFPHFRR